IFSGNPQQCSSNTLGFSNCCQDSGWGIDLHLTHCNAEEKSLGINKQAGLTVYLGEYCRKKILGHCQEKRKTYCTFPSKLARIIQQQGRFTQLGVSFGQAKNPICRGISAEELQ